MPTWTCIFESATAGCRFGIRYLRIGYDRGRVGSGQGRAGVGSG